MNVQNDLVSFVKTTETMCSHLFDLVTPKIQFRMHIDIIDLVIITTGKNKDVKFHSSTAPVQLSFQV